MWPPVSSRTPVRTPQRPPVADRPNLAGVASQPPSKKRDRLHRVIEWPDRDSNRSTEEGLEVGERFYEGERHPRNFTMGSRRTFDNLEWSLDAPIRALSD